MHYAVHLGKSCRTACQSDHRQLVKEKKQANTHHQQGKKDDPTAPDVCFPPIVLLSLRTPKCLLAGRCPAWLKHWTKKLLARWESLKNAIPWWPLDRHSAEICWRNGGKFSVNKSNTREAAGQRVRFKVFFFPVCAPAKSELHNLDTANNEKGPTQLFKECEEHNIGGRQQNLQRA